MVFLSLVGATLLGLGQVGRVDSIGKGMTMHAIFRLGMVATGVVLTVFTSAAAGESSNGWKNALQPRQRGSAELALAVDGRAQYKIVIPQEASSQERKAADDLAYWLKEITGAEFSIGSDSVSLGERTINIGSTELFDLAKLRIDRRSLGDEGYAIVVRGAHLFLIGGRTRGPINAVYALLEEDLGCRWYTPRVQRIPRLPTLKFRPAPRTYIPPLRLRDPFYKAAFDGTWSLRNRTNAPNAPVPEEWGGHVNYALFVHTYHSLVPPAEFFETHPEYYQLNAEGKRVAHQLCQTNLDAIRIATERALKVLDEKPASRMISISKVDGGGSCVCEHCAAVAEAEGGEMGPLLYFVNRVAKGIEVRYPDVVVSTLAYLETVKPPKTLRPRRNVAIRLCTDNCMWEYPFTPARDTPAFHEALTRWSAVYDRIHIWDYCVNFSHYTAPMPNMDVIASNIRFFVENNAEAVMMQAAYQSPAAERDEMRSWVIAKLLWDPSRDLLELMLDFNRGFYGRAAPEIERYEALLRKTAEEHKATLASPKGGIRYAMDDPFLSEAFLAEATACFDRAEKLAEDDEIFRRVRRARLPILYVRLCRGPEGVGEGYEELLDSFETIARREGLTHIYEGAPDLEKKLEAWRALAKSR